MKNHKINPKAGMVNCTEYCDWMKNKVTNREVYGDFFNLSPVNKIKLFIKETIKN